MRRSRRCSGGRLIQLVVTLVGLAMVLAPRSGAANASDLEDSARALSSPPTTKRLRIAADGRAVGTILWWSRGASPTPAFAAHELRRYFARMTGARVPVVAGKVTTHRGLSPIESAVVVSGGRRRRIPGYWLRPAASDASVLREDGFISRSGDGRIVLAGTTHRGTLFASYDLLERVGVRFYAPAFSFYGGRHERVPRHPTLKISPIDSAQQPQFPHRPKYVGIGYSHRPRAMNQLIDWMAKSRHNTLVIKMRRWGDAGSWLPALRKRNIITQAGGHGYHTFLPPEVYSSAHPRWFPPRTTVFDATRKGALSTYTANVLAFLRANPQIRRFDAWPPDKAIWPERTTRVFGSVANAQAHVTNALTRRVDRANIHARVGALVDWPAVRPPSGRMYHPSSYLTFAPPSRGYGKTILAPNHYFPKRIKAWQRAGFHGMTGVMEYYVKYVWHSLPLIMSELISKEVPFYRSLNVRSLGIYSEPADWMTYELTHYLVARLTWDGSRPGSAMVRGYLRNRYGEAAALVADYLQQVETAGRALFPKGFAGHYGNLEAVATARHHFLAARRRLRAASDEVSPGSSAAFVLRRLIWNASFAIADTSVSYHRLRREPRLAKKALRRTRRLVQRHADDGIILDTGWQFLRWEPLSVLLQMPPAVESNF